MGGKDLIEQCKKLEKELTDIGFEYVNLGMSDNSGEYIVTPSYRTLKLMDLLNIYHDKLEFGNPTHIENSKALMYANALKILYRRFDNLVFS